MSNFTPTQGPYFVRTDRQTRDGDFLVATADGNDLAIVSNGDIHGEANAYLFAASSELFAACKAQSIYEIHLECCDSCSSDIICGKGARLKSEALRLRRIGILKAEKRAV